MGKKSRSRGITITKIGPSNNQIFGLLIGGIVIGGAAVYLLPIYVPQLYQQLDKASGGVLSNINKGISSGLQVFGIK